MQYAAFISYSRKDPDRRVARSIQRRLETLTIPPSLREGASGAKRLGRVFLDDEELAAAPDLTSSIHDALRASRYLVFVGSPRSAASTWVSREIELFVDHVDHERVLPVLVEGEPTESLTPALRHWPEGVEPRWVDMRPLAAKPRGAGMHSVVLQLAAAILGCPLDDLVRRDRQRRVRRRNAVLLTLAGLMALSIYVLIAYVVPYLEVERQGRIERLLVDGFTGGTSSSDGIAREYLDEVLREDPAHPEAFIGLLLYHSQNESPPDAYERVFAEHRAAVDAHPELRFAKIVIYRYSGRLQEAAALEAEFVRMNGYLVELIRAVGELWNAREGFTEKDEGYSRAAVHFLTAILMSKSPRSPVYFMLAEVAEHLEDPRVTEICRRALVEQWPESSEAWFRAGNLYSQAEEYEQAIDAYRNAIGLEPDHPDAWLRLGDALWSSAKRDEANTAYERAYAIWERLIAAEGATAGTFLIYGKSLHREGEYRDAVGAYTRGLEKHPLNDDLSYFRALARVQIGDKEGALKDVRRCVELAPEWVPYRLLLSRELSKAGRSEDALAVALKAADDLPDEVAVQSYAANLLAREERWTDALVRYRRILELTPSDHVAAQALGASLAHLERWPELAEYLRAWWDKASELEEWRSIAELCEAGWERFDKDLHNMARRAATKAVIKTRRKDAAALHAQGRIFEKLGRFRQARIALQHAVEALYPDSKVKESETYKSIDADLQRVTEKLGN